MEFEADVEADVPARRDWNEPQRDVGDRTDGGGATVHATDGHREEEPSVAISHAYCEAKGGDEVVFKQSPGATL